MSRRYFGTDGVRGIVGELLTPELVERLGRASTLWAGAQTVNVGCDTRASGPELVDAFARGVISAGAECVLVGVLPTPAVALLPGDLGVVVSASHNPPEYNGVKFFEAGGGKLSDRSEEQIEELLAAPPASEQGAVRQVEGAADEYLRYVLDHFGADLAGRRVVVDCANGAYSGLAPRAFAECGAEVRTIGDEPDGTNINTGCGATDTALLERTVVEGGYDLGIAFDGDGDRMLAVDERGRLVDGDQILAILAPYLGVGLVAVTVMTNLGFHAAMATHGIEVVTTDVGDRYVLEALHREGGILGGEQSGHILYLRDHVTGDGLVAGLLLCAALGGTSLAAAADAMPRFVQVKENVRVEHRELTAAVVAEVERVNREWAGKGRVLVRASGTEPVIRVLAEAAGERDAQEACGSISMLVRRELG